MCSLVTNQLITDRKGATQIVNNNLLWGVSEQHFFMCTVNNMESNKKISKKYGEQQKKYRHGTQVFVNRLKLDPLFMVFGHFCNNKK